LQITEDRKKGIIDLYFNQHKTYAEIAETEHISLRDIHAIIKEEEDRGQKYEHEKQQREISSKAYELFSEGERSIEVAIALSLREPETTKYYREYWKLKRLDILNSIYTETNGKLGPFLKLYRLIEKRGMNIEQVVNAVDIAIHKLPYMEGLYKQLKDEVDKMQRTRQQLENYLHKLKEEIASAKSLLNSYHTLCERKRQELENINSEASRIVTLVNRFKSNNEEYLKIEKTVEEKVKSVLTDNKQILQFALASIIEALIRNLDKYNNLLVCNASSSSSAIPIQQLPSWHIDGCKYMILDESKEFYDMLLKHFTNSILDNTVSK
jgi:hypothetical protein